MTDAPSNDLSAQPIENRLYPSSVPTPAVEADVLPLNQEAAAPQEQAVGTIAEPAPGDLPDAIRELRDDPLRRMYSAQSSFASVKLDLEDQALAAAATTELREMFADVGASPADAQEIMAIGAQMAATADRSPEALAVMRNSAIDAVNRQYGNDAAAAVRDAQKLVARDPRLAAAMNATGLGDHPQMVLKLITLARSARARGELK